MELLIKLLSLTFVSKSISKSLLIKNVIFIFQKMFCGPARDALLSNQETEKLNFDTSYITILYYSPPPSPEACLTACAGADLRKTKVFRFQAALKLV